MDARETLAMYVAGGNMREAEPSPAMDPKKTKELRQRLATIKEGGSLPAATDAPADFRAAIEDKEAKVNEAELKSKGRDVPRWNPQNAIMKQVYRAHDAVTALPTPSGLGMIIFIIFVFFLVLIPATAAGETRTLLLWDVLLGKKEIPPVDVPVVDAGSGTPTPKSQAGVIAGAIGGGIAGGVLPGLGPIIGGITGGILSDTYPGLNDSSGDYLAGIGGGVTL